MKRYPIQSSGTKIFFEINLIGYKNMGESVVLSVKDELEKILWCGVIDCYKYKSYNKTKLILDEYGYGDDRKIDFLCISHPDHDHILSVGKIIDKYTNDSTMFVMPNFFDSHICQTKEIIRIKEVVGSKFSRPRSRGDIVDNLFFNRTKDLKNLKWEFISGTRKYNMQIESLTPPDALMYNSQNVNYQQFKNDFSVCLKINFNDNIFLFMGDCTDNLLLYVDDDDIPHEISYLKIPHHGCKNEAMESYFYNEIIEYLDVSGCAYRKNTTLASTLDFYKDYCNYVSVTGNIEPCQNKFKYGILKHIYDISSGELILEKCLESGNAIFKYN